MIKVPEKNLLHKVIDMAWPAILESFFIAFAGMVDSYMVSGLGKSAVAAVGLTTQPKLVGFALFFAVNAAVAALVARRRGEGKRDAANNIFVTTFLFVIVAGVLSSILFVGIADPLMHLCGSEESTHGDAVDYFQIIMGGMIFNVIQMCINASQRGAGNTKITMRTNVTSNVINIIANYLLIEGHFGFPALGIRGAAIATVFGSAVACVMSILSIRKKDCFVSIPYILAQKIRPAWESFRSLVHVGYSVFFEQLLMRIGFMMTALMAADQGMDAMAAHQVGMNILSLSFAFGDGLQSTAVALIGRSLGEKNPELAKAYGQTCRFIGGVIAATLAVVYLLGGGLLYSLFFEEQAIVDIGVHIIYVVIFIVMFQIAQVIYMGSLRGAGDTLYTAIASTISVTLIRTFGSYFFGYVLGWGIVGIWMGILADQVARFCFGSVRFRAGKWVNIKI